MGGERQDGMRTSAKEGLVWACHEINSSAPRPSRCRAGRGVPAQAVHRANRRAGATKIQRCSSRPNAEVVSWLALIHLLPVLVALTTFGCATKIYQGPTTGRSAEQQLTVSAAADAVVEGFDLDIAKDRKVY